MQQLQLKGKTAVISGAGRGIGRQIALTFAREGADVILLSKSGGEELNQVANECEALGVGSLPLKADVSRQDDVNQAVQQGLARFKKIDVLVNVVGLRQHRPFLEVDFTEWQAAFGVNCNSLFHLAKAIIPGMIEHKGGSIVALGGQSAMRPSNHGASVTSSKHAEYGLIKSLALEFGPYGIRANMVQPGLTNVERRNPEWYPEGTPVNKGKLEKTPLRRTADAQEIANVVLFLASDQSSYVTGDRILAVGGAYMG